MPNSLAVMAACSPIDMPVRGSPLRRDLDTQVGQQLQRVDQLVLRGAERLTSNTAHRLRDGDRGVGGGVDATADSGVVAAAGHTVGDGGDGLQAVRTCWISA